METIRVKVECLCGKRFKARLATKTGNTYVGCKTCPACQATYEYIHRNGVTYRERF